MELRIVLLLSLALPGLGVPQNDDLYEQGLDDCFSEQGICAVHNDMERCTDYEGNEYYQCWCESGYLSASRACDDCQNVYSMEPIVLWSDYSSSCDDLSFTIAPIPQSVLDQVSSHNATRTGGVSSDITSPPDRPGEVDPSDLTTDADTTSQTPALEDDFPDVPMTTTMQGGPTPTLPTFLDSDSDFGQTPDAAAGLDRGAGNALAVACGFGMYWMAN